MVDLFSHCRTCFITRGPLRSIFKSKPEGSKENNKKEKLKARATETNAVEKQANSKEFMTSVHMVET